MPSSKRDVASRPSRAFPWFQCGSNLTEVNPIEPKKSLANSGQIAKSTPPDPLGTSHNPKVAGSNPAPATTETPSRQGVFVLNRSVDSRSVVLIGFQFGGGRAAFGRDIVVRWASAQMGRAGHRPPRRGASSFSSRLHSERSPHHGICGLPLLPDHGLRAAPSRKNSPRAAGAWAHAADALASDACAPRSGSMTTSCSQCGSGLGARSARPGRCCPISLVRPSRGRIDHLPTTPRRDITASGRCRAGASRSPTH